MAMFDVLVTRINDILPHPNADAIEFAVIGGYHSIVAKKDNFRKDDLVVYIPEQSVVPEYILKRMNLWDYDKNRGKLAGSMGNRVRATRLRGELSQGLTMKIIPHPTDGFAFVESDTDKVAFEEGKDVADFLGIQKYEEPIPVALVGEVFSFDVGFIPHFDVENIKKFPNILELGEEVVFDEKIHGTCSGLTLLPKGISHPEAFGVNRNILIYSKGLGAKGICLKNNEANANNLYVRSFRNVVAKLEHMEVETPLHVFGETFGPGVQDLHYTDSVTFRVFAIGKGLRADVYWYNVDEREDFVHNVIHEQLVPVLYRGPFTWEKVAEFTNGKTTMGKDHIREGIVIQPAKTRMFMQINRVLLKSISEDYLLRKNGSEYN